MQVFLKSTGAAVTLGPDAFVAQGGEGKVFAKDGVAYKLYHDPAGAPPADKLAALARITAPQVITPQDVLLDPQRHAVGYTMRHVDGAHPLCRLFNKGFRQRHGLTPKHDALIAEALRQALAHVHAHGVLVVDLNELNVLVGAGFQSVSLIDVDSWQTPGHPATAILDSVRDRHATRFDVGTDWFAWAVITCQLFLGVHPYKGSHPTLKGLDARMQANASVFDPQVKCPPAARPLGSIPADLRAWYEAVFQRGLRTPPPPVLPGVAPTVAALTDGRSLTVRAVWQAPSPILRAVEHLGTLVVVAEDGVWVDRRKVGPRPPGPVAIGFAGRDHRPVIAHVAAGRLHLFDAQRRAPVPSDLAAQAVTATRDGRLLALSGGHLVEVRLHPVGDTLLAAPRVLARVRPAATELFDGVAVERLPQGAQALVSLAPGQVVPVPLPAGRVVDARADGPV
ncbi:MAG: hypothetical protein KC613_27415, partial [Myxococcales bacterium]|nr:hypothetical protein [Myxococcales bacterium]